MIDWSQVERLRDDLGAEVFPEIAEAFLQELETQAAGLDMAPATAAVMQDRFHTMKGSALYLGFADLAAVCAEAEACAKAGGDSVPWIKRAREVHASSARAFRTSAWAA